MKHLCAFILCYWLLVVDASQSSDVHQKFVHVMERIHRIHIHEENRCSNWVVVTTINGVTDSVRAVANLPDWCVVVVGDRKSVSKLVYQLQGVVYLDVETQRKLDYSIIEFLPYDSYTRKNIGYLYAIQHGATKIYETDDDNKLLSDLTGFLPAEHETLVYDSMKNYVVNPYSHFGQPSIWPRGYPLSQITKQDSTQFVKQRVNSWIQQSLENGDPDVDAIFRLTRKTDEERIDIQFDSAAPPVSLPEGVFCPYNSQNTLHHHQAFWALLIPVGVSFRVSDIWRSYWAQRLLWQIGGQVTFLPPFVYQDRNAHDYMQDFHEELQLYTETERLIHFLLEWLPESNSFVEQIKELSRDMYHEGFWSAEDVQLVDVWCDDLINIGYEFPEFSHTTLPRASQIITKQPKLLPTSMMKHLYVTQDNNKDYVNLFICILAAPGETSLRDTVRETYLSFLDDYDVSTIQYRFFTDYKDEETHKLLLQEQQRYGDLHISTAGVHCPEGQHCKTSFGLVVEALQWTLENYMFNYFLRLDLDGYLCIPQLMQDLEKRPKRAYVAGNFGCHAQEPDRFFRADGAFILFTYDLAQKFIELQPLLHKDETNTFAINFASFVFHLDVTFEHRMWSTNITAVCERQVFVHWLKIEKRIKKAHTLALSRLNNIPITPLRNVCENRVTKGQKYVNQNSEFWGEHRIHIKRHWP